MRTLDRCLSFLEVKRRLWAFCRSDHEGNEGQGKPGKRERALLAEVEKRK